MIDSATGVLNSGRSVPCQVADRRAPPRRLPPRHRTSADVEDHPERGDDDLAGGERGEDGAADPPVPAQRHDGRLDQPPRSAEEALPFLAPMMRSPTPASAVSRAAADSVSPAAAASSRSARKCRCSATRGAASRGDRRG